MQTTRRTLLKQSAASLAMAGLGARRAPAQEPAVRIGVIYDLSGPFAAAGSVACAIGAQTAIDLVNEKGGVAGKYKVEPINADSQSKTDAAINEVERLINQEKVDIVLGVYSSAHAVPLAAKVEEQKKILWITTAVATSVFKDKNFHYVFRAQIHSDQYGQAGVSFIAENAKAKLGIEPKDVKVAIIHEDGPYGVGVADADERFAKEKGLQVVMREGYSATAPDLSSLVTKLKRARADVIYHAGYNPDITLFLRQSREAGLRFKMLIGNGAGYSQLDKLRATFGQGHRRFLQRRSGSGTIAQAGNFGARHGRPDQSDGRALPRQDQRHRCAAARIDGFQPDLGAAQRCAPRGQTEIRRLRRRGGAQGSARRRHPARRHHPGLRGQILSARHAVVRAERTLDPGGDAICRRAHHRGMAEQHQDPGAGAAASRLVDLRDELSSAANPKFAHTQRQSRCELRVQKRH